MPESEPCASSDAAATSASVDPGLACLSLLAKYFEKPGDYEQLRHRHGAPTETADDIALADPSISLDRVVQAAEIAGAHEFISELAEGYDTVLAERGGSLSGGQRHRIVIARALVTNPRILIFDEATSALDYESEKAIQTNMRRICADRTVFIIAHRLSTVAEAHRIVVIDKGEIAEDGSHAELLRTGGRYAKLWQAQTGPAMPAPEVVRRPVALRMAQPE